MKKVVMIKLSKITMTKTMINITMTKEVMIKVDTINGVNLTKLVIKATNSFLIKMILKKTMILRIISQIIRTLLQ